MIDARIPLMGQQIDAGAMIERAQNMRLRDFAMQQQQAEADRRQRLSELLPGAVQGDQEAIRGLAAVDPELFMRLDDRQRQQAAKELADVHSAVRWAQTPEQWAQVQQRYAGVIPGAESIPFEQRESVLLQLGQMGEYLKSAPQPKFIPVEPGGSLYVGTPGGDVRPAILPNPGNAAPGASAGPPQSAIDALRRGEGTPEQFDAIFGPGAAQRALGGGGGGNVTSNFP